MSTSITSSQLTPITATTADAIAAAPIAAPTSTTTTAPAGNAATATGFDRGAGRAQRVTADYQTWSAQNPGGSIDAFVASKAQELQARMAQRGGGRGPTQAGTDASGTTDPARTQTFLTRMTQRITAILSGTTVPATTS